jgi:Transposase Tn5 dimerisation domain
MMPPKGWFLDRKGDGEPGWQTLWRGYRRLQDIVPGA